MDSVTRHVSFAQITCTFCLMPCITLNKQ